MAAPSKSARSVAVIGAGIIGCSVAYQLSLRGYKPTIIERTNEIAPGASGKAGGFLAKTWNDQSAIGPLARRSFDLHEEHGALFKDTLYRKMDAWSVSVHPEAAPKVLAAQNLAWLNSAAVSGLSHLSGEETSAQVHPLRYTQALFEECKTRGATLVHGEATQINVDGNAKIHLLLPSGETVISTFDLVVVCAGSWSGELLKPILERNVLGAIKATSVVLQPSGPVPNVALFTDWYTPGEDCNYDPEVYPRSDGTVYICARAEPVEIPLAGPAVVLPEPNITERIQKFAAQLSANLQDAPLLATQSCLLPTSEDDVPIIGALLEPHLYVATAHSCWGILNAPATGEAIAQLIHGEPTELDLEPFNPKRFLESSAD